MKTARCLFMACLVLAPNAFAIPPYGDLPGVAEVVATEKLVKAFTPSSTQADADQVRTLLAQARVAIEDNLGSDQSQNRSGQERALLRRFNSLVADCFKLKASKTEWRPYRKTTQIAVWPGGPVERAQTATDLLFIDSQMSELELQTPIRSIVEEFHSGLILAARWPGRPRAELEMEKGRDLKFLESVETVIQVQAFLVAFFGNDNHFHSQISSREFIFEAAARVESESDLQQFRDLLRRSNVDEIEFLRFPQNYR